MEIDSLEQLRAHYPPAQGRALSKQLDHLDPHCIAFIGLSPFVVLATGGAGGQLDASPRGGAPGFVHVLDAHTLLLPDAKGNNRLDSFSNIAEMGRAGLLFMIPGVDETLRVNGEASLSDDAALLAYFAGERNPPRLLMRLRVAEAYLHCAKALMRARLWDSTAQVERSVLPTMGRMIGDQTGSIGPLETQEQMLARYAQDL
ncbi:pyridoxamine 5'-phosphate oxidase [Janthinobacterium sp. HH103]|uniref:pyridoxamine 5'-phosphate oxidase family protein n=1 Tax=unclassified Janthinobacterium TaxID=2610881 RepID=UPI000875A163|nr:MULTISPECIES: pyridoxamine 5'-phosphate oxidase family protein [unclassified Janthinobacterium]OEZ66114.1 pyridoxamine 5'-phosphate oxidase [Janthinobacterium sp. HH100]OEZ87107.1 pyridoxamine 5'-phosphate oxidase [Janthinobacterium sp. HH103]QOU73011.1 Pyridoxamine 5'-phosphate oxidase [Janthinobacterium sp. HH102]